MSAGSRWEKYLVGRLTDGVVDAEFFKGMVDAWIYDSATPIRWLARTLVAPRGLLEVRGSLSLYEARERRQITVDTTSAFDDWASRHFPGVREEHAD